MILMFNEVKEHKGDNLVQQYRDDLGYDIRSGEDRIIPAKSFETIYTGLSMCLPWYLGAVIMSRSGLAFNEGIEVSTAGTIDSGYRGAVKVLLHNQTEKRVLIEKGRRIAQLVFHFKVEAVLEILSTMFRNTRDGEEVQFPEFKIQEVDIVLWPKRVKGDRGRRGVGSSGKF